ncbi:MAG TPA: M14 family zinc carboxypeptidase, partial [Vicinamibacterales bacterium]|nr:M14 family zinc carboxypeptidase [Vicinamibacterales bacterium]
MSHAHRSLFVVIAAAAIALPLPSSRLGARERPEAAGQPPAAGAYDPKVPTPQAILGYEIGTYHTNYAGLERWLAALRGADRVRIVRYGESAERTPLYLIIVSSPQNLARLDEIRVGMRRLADPRTTTEAEAASLAASLPAVAWMNHGNDGNESAAFESAILTSYQLAAGTDETTRRILDRLVTIINPAHNPESHERFVAWYNATQVGRAGTADPAAAEHHAPWGMSTNNNHYQIDLNRDAFFVTQPETAAIVRAYGEWNPVVFVDHHGQTKNMFFPPPAEAVNLNVTPEQVDWMDRYGHAIASAFDRRGWSYYRRGRFDLFYAGFWDSWPTLNGSIGLTFETDGGGSKGLAWEREDGTVLTLRDGVIHHHTATMATLALTAERKEERLRDFYRYKQTAIEEGRREPMKQVVLLPGRDPLRAALLAELLRLQRIEVLKVSAPYRLSRAHAYLGGGPSPREVPAGAYVVPMAQPQKRLAKALLEIEPGFRDSFLAEEQRKKRRAELVGRWPRDGFYDVTAWSLPLLFGVEAVWAEDPPPAGLAPMTGEPAYGVAPPRPDPAPPAPGRATYGYLFAGESYAAVRLASRLLAEGFNLAVASEPFRVGGRDFERGAFLARVERNPEALAARIAALAAETGVAVQALESARVERGPDFGEDPVVEIPPPRIAMVTAEPTDERSYGAAWFTLEQRLGLPFTALRIEQLREADLRRYRTIILPHGSPAEYQSLLGEPGIARLKRWTEEGGTLVLIKGAAAFATRKGVELTGSTLKRHEARIRLFFEDTESPERATSPKTTDGAEGTAGAGQAPRAAGPAKPAAGQAEGRAEAPQEEKPLTREMDLVRTAGAILRV